MDSDTFKIAMLFLALSAVYGLLLIADGLARRREDVIYLVRAPIAEVANNDDGERVSRLGN